MSEGSPCACGGTIPDTCGIRLSGGQPDGARGSFQDRFPVHLREGEPCVRCGTTIVKLRAGTVASAVAGLAPPSAVSLGRRAKPVSACRRRLAQDPRGLGDRRGTGGGLVGVDEVRGTWDRHLARARNGAQGAPRRAVKDG